MRALQAEAWDCPDGATKAAMAEAREALRLLDSSGANSMERTRPRQINLLGAKSCRRNSLDSPDHFFGGSAGKRHQQDTVRINPADDKMRNPTGKGLRLPGASAGNHQERRGCCRCAIYAMLYGATLFLVQISQIVGGHDRQPLLIRSLQSSF